MINLSLKDWSEADERKFQRRKLQLLKAAFRKQEEKTEIEEILTAVKIQRFHVLEREYSR